MPTGTQINALFKDIRQDYVTDLSAALSARSVDRVPWQCEPIIRDSAGRIARHNVLNLPERADFRCPKDGSFQRFAALKTPDFEPFTFRDGNAEFYLTPFAWDNLRITYQSALPHNLNLIRKWYLEWFLPRKLDETGPWRGTVHGLAGPKIADDLAIFTVDLGTAPTAALQDLIAKSAGMGIQKLMIGDGRQPAVQVAV